MCTVTWSFTPDGGGWTLDLGFNRDERRSRPLARPPRVHRPVIGMPFLAPVDPVGGGTWISLNVNGLCLGLLNLYGAETGLSSVGSTISRGRLVMQLAGLPDSTAVRAGLRRILAVERLQPFQLLIVQGGAGHEALLQRWDGRTLREQAFDAELGVLSSSAHATAEVVAGRLAQHAAAVQGWADGEAEASAMTAFHRSHLPERGPRSVCMHRSDARTVSYSQLRASAAELSFRYAAGAPCRAALGPPLRLARVS